MTRVSKPPRSGFNLVELLIVIAIIGLLLQLSIPAVRSAREASRRTACSNNLRQLALAAQAHDGAHGHYPAGGWGYLYVGDPNRGVGPAQPGGWIYNTLPYVEQTSLHDLPRGKDDAARHDATQAMLAHYVPVFNCPSRPRARLLKFEYEPRNYGNYRPPKEVGKSDYAGNAGDFWTSDTAEENEGPPDYDAADAPGADDAEFWMDVARATGVFYQRSTTRTADVTDGLSSTYLAGEKSLDAANYKYITTSGDDQCMYVGFDADIVRWASLEENYRPLPPTPDARDVTNDEGFGSPHSSGCLFAFCDGSVKIVSYKVDALVHRRQANRHDSEVAAQVSDN